MKKHIILFMIIISNGYSQQNPNCQFVPYPEMFNTNNYTNRFQTITDPNEPLVFNVKMHGFHQTDGSDIHNVNEDRFLRMIASLNIHFNQFNIFFKYRGFDIINDSNYVNIGGAGQPTIAQMVQKVHDEGLYDENAINIFVNHGASSGGYRDVYCSTTNNDDAFYNYVLPHEMGHTLGLLHIQSSNEIYTSNFSDNMPSCMFNPVNPFSPYMTKPVHPAQQPSFQNENVTRIIGNPNYNADIAGDLVADTQACFMGYTNNYCKNITNLPFPNITDYTIWVEHPNVVDFVGETYKCTTVESHNIMGQGISTSFTAGQGARMRQHIIANANEVFNQRLNLLENGDADVSVLFEPYESTIVPGEIVSTTDLGNGYAKVCRAWLMQQKFQPGFTYYFPQNSDTDPINVANTDFPVPPVKHHTFDYPVTIAQLDPAITNLTTNTGYASVVCTRGLICNEETFKMGTIISTRDLLNMNVNIEELDAIRVKDPQLYDSLMSQYYYKLKKETESGAKVESVFYKP